VYLDGVYTGDATYGVERSDMAAAYGARFARSGYTYLLSLSATAAGSHVVEVRVRASASGSLSSFLRGVRRVSIPTYPSGSLDSPLDNSSVSGSVQVSGWALDMGAASGSGVDRVHVWVDGQYVGDAALLLSRPDISAAYGARFANSGFAYQLSLAGLAPGSHTVEARARSAATGLDTGYRRAIQVPISYTQH
jgi:hypothetical protein